MTIPSRAALECLAEGFQIIGPDWRYVSVNPAAARRGRHEASALIGKPMVEAYPGTIAQSCSACCATVWNGRRARWSRTSSSSPDGSARWFELRIRPVPAGICIYSADIEHRKRPQSLVRRYRICFAEAPAV
jgi:PAS domain-containing protein